MLNIAELAPMPRASATTARAVTAGALRSVRRPNRMSCSRVVTCSSGRIDVGEVRRVPFSAIVVGWPDRNDELRGGLRGLNGRAISTRQALVIVLRAEALQ